MTEEHATWVYAVVPQAPPVPLESATGVAGEPVRLVAHADLRAVVGSLPAADADEDTLRRRLNDPEWLELAARRHHRVVTSCFQAVPTVPFRLATVYHDDERVAEMLAGRRQHLRRALATVARRVEWGVQAFAALPAPSAGTPETDPDPARPGTAYLLRRRAQRSAADAERRSAAQAAGALHSALEHLAAAAAAQPLTGRPPMGGPDGPQGQMVLHAAYLVDDHRQEAFLDAARDLGERHPALRVRLTGPWPAYSFVEVGTEVAA